MINAEAHTGKNWKDFKDRKDNTPIGASQSVSPQAAVQALEKERHHIRCFSVVKVGGDCLGLVNLRGISVVLVE
jgi:hypothetical protein